MDQKKKESKTKKVKKLNGVALRDTKDRTLLVAVTTVKLHPVYGKRYKAVRRFLVHSDMEVRKGEGVTIEETRPISKKKAWKVIKKIE